MDMQGDSLWASLLLVVLLLSGWQRSPHLVIVQERLDFAAEGAHLVLVQGDLLGQVPRWCWPHIRVWLGHLLLLLLLRLQGGAPANALLSGTQ
jgi:hypothetical protein